MQRYVISQQWEPGQTELWLRPDVAMSITHILSNVTAQGIVVVTGIYVGDSPNQLVVPIDAWIWSLSLRTELIEEFYKVHGLFGKTQAFVEWYLNEKRISLPDPNRIALPLVKRSEGILLTGKAKERTALSFVGLGQRSL